MEPWFDPQKAGLIGGIIGACIGGAGAIIGSTCWLFIRKGWKRLVYGMFGTVITVSVGLLVTGLIALFMKQPYHVWYPFLLSGVIGTVVFSPLFLVMRRLFTVMEMRKMQAKDL